MKRFIVKNLSLVVAVVAFTSLNALAEGPQVKLTDKSAAIFAVYYDQNGDIVKVDVTEYAKKGCKVRAEGKELTNELIAKIIAEHSRVEIIDGNIIHCYGSPDCWIWIGGFPICICCY